MLNLGLDSSSTHRELAYEGSNLDENLSDHLAAVRAITRCEQAFGDLLFQFDPVNARYGPTTEGFDTI